VGDLNQVLDRLSRLAVFGDRGFHRRQAAVAVEALGGGSADRELGVVVEDVDRSPRPENRRRGRPGCRRSAIGLWVRSVQNAATPAHRSLLS
jgi:hypothetical protein